MIGNLFPADAIPFDGCFQESWPLQIEMQLFLLIPIIAFSYKKYPRVTLMTGAILVLINLMILFSYYHSHGITISYINMRNYRFGLNSVNKPWSHFSSFFFGFLLAVLN